MRIDPEHLLSLETTRVIQAMIAAAPEPLPGPLVDDDLLARFACGWVSADEQNAVVARMVDSAELRHRFLQIRDKLKELSVRPWSAVKDDPEIPALSACLSELMRFSMSAYGRLRQWCLNHDWSVTRTSADAEARAIRSALASTGAAIRSQLLRPNFAVMRGEENQPSVSKNFPVEVTPSLNAVVNPEGALHIEIALTGSSELNGSTIFVELIDPSQCYVFLGSGVVEDRRATIDVPGFLEMFKLGPGALPAALFCIGTDVETNSRNQPGQLFATIERGAGAMPSSFTPIQLVEPARIENGDLVVSLSLNGFDRQDLSEYDLELSMVIANLPIQLGLWPVREWTSDLRTFRILIPETADGPIECGSVLRARFLPHKFSG